MSESWGDWKRRQLTKPLKVDKVNVVIRVGPIDIGCKWIPAFDERYEVCVYHGEQRKKEARG